MKNFRRDMARFFNRNRNKGIPNLMLYIAIGNIIVTLLTYIDPSKLVYSVLCFDRSAILSGQVWRLVTYIFTYLGDLNWTVFLGLISLFLYYQFGKMLEGTWGVLKFNLYYLCGLVLMDVAALALNAQATVLYLNLSLFLAIATIAPESKILLFFIIPIKLKYLAWFYLASNAFSIYQSIAGMIQQHTFSFAFLFPLVALLNYFLFFGAEVRNLFVDPSRPRRRRTPPSEFVVDEPGRKYSRGTAHGKASVPYRHKCTVCGRTDAEYPDLEFRYCSKCRGYYCYCIDHINNHVHITE